MFKFLSSNFNLDKIYFDCIDEEGNCFIIYWANLKFKLLNFTYTGLIFSDSTNKVLEKSSLKFLSRPVIHDKIIADNTRLNILASYDRIDPGYSLSLLKNSEGQDILWNCHHPKANTKISFAGKEFKGLGYSETITLPIAPWELPIDELRWGRFLSKEATIVWINWKGSYPVNKLFYNGKLYEDAFFEEYRVLFDNNKLALTFQNPSIVRRGKLSGILENMPWLKILFSNRILTTIENKYKAKTILEKKSTKLADGWSLYEVVTWPKN